MILVAGEALIDMLPVPPENDLLRPVLGGSPFNVACALGLLGVPVRFLCRLSQDPFGEKMVRRLTECGVDLGACPRTPALSTLGFVSFAAGASAPHYAFYTENTAGCSLERRDLPVPLDPAIECVQVGSFSLAIEPFGSALESLLFQHAGDRCVALDPNIRPFLIADRDRFLKRYLRLVGRADLIKLSHEDLEWLHPRTNAEEVATAYLDAGVGLVLVTAGKDRVLARTRGARAEFAPPPVVVADTVGAGDTFQAATLTWLREHGGLGRDRIRSLGAEELGALLRFASAAAGITCTRVGCQPPRRVELPAV